MTEIIKTDKPTPKILQSSSFAEILASRKAVTTRCLLLDCSGSMELKCRDGKQRIEHLREMVSEFEAERKFAFSSHCEEVSDIPYAHGGTAMDLAFETIKAAGVSHAVIVTDGQPDNEESALKAAQGLKLDILYVGDGDPPKFLQRLATLTGGKFGVENLERQKQLASLVKGLLTGGTL